MSVSRTILLLTDVNYAFGRGVMRGIAAYARPELPWRFVRMSPHQLRHEHIRAVDPAGIIGELFAPQFLKKARDAGRLVVNTVDPTGEDNDHPGVYVDDVACGRLAVEHFSANGLSHFAYVGYRRFPPGQRRLRGMREAAGGHDVTPLWISSQASPVQRRTHLPRESGPTGTLSHWLHELPKPVGILVAHDPLGMEVAQCCRDLGLAVPEDVAVLGVHNDDVTCHLSFPPLSSIDTPADRVGYEAAAMLHRLLDRRRKSAPLRVVLPPVGVIARTSTNVVAVEDADVRDVIQYMRDHAHQGMNIEVLLDAVPMSRRSLQRKVRETLGVSPVNELRRIRIERARSLLVHTDLPMPAVADACGFSGASRFSKVFKEVVGLPPLRYRKQFRVR